MRGLFHATPRWRRVHYKSIRANKAFSCSVSGGVNTRSKPRMWRETFKPYNYYQCENDEMMVVVEMIENIFTFTGHPSKV